MDRFALLVDGGYLVAAAAGLIAKRIERRSIRLDFEALRKVLLETAVRLAAPASLLRLYWYDACIDGRPSPWHRKLGDMPDIKIRLGHLRGTPARQKGVDSLIVRDLTILAQERSIVDAVLVSGDEDLREAVVYAQERGVRVHLVVVTSTSASWTLRQEADTVTTLMPSHVSQFASVAPEASLP